MLYLAACLSASVAGPTVLYSFSNSDGQAPASRMVLASDGNLYGTTLHGGACGAGSFFRLIMAGSLSNLYSFPAATNGIGESNYDLGPNDLVQGTDGNFYGTTRQGGSNFSGTIFKISPTGSFTLLHTFAAESLNLSGYQTSADGAMPAGALVQGSDGNFYGTTRYGGSNDAGTVFQVTPDGAFTSLYSFTLPSTGSVATSGAVPNALTLGGDGAFYGTTQQGGPINAGTFFKYTVAGGFTQLYSFNDETPGNNPITPNSTLVQGANGVFYGTTAYGGTQGGGCIFEITNTGGANVLCSLPELDAGASDTLTLGSNGIFYGTTAENGVNGQGTLFRATPQGDYSAYSFSALDTNSDNACGANPSAGLTADNAGSFYGTCAAGGTNGSGLVFQIFGPDFIPPSFFPVTNWPPAQTNTLVGSSVTLSYPAQGIAPLSYRWLDGSNYLADGGDISGSTTGTLTIDPVLSRDVGNYALVISNTWGALTSSVTVLTIEPPGIAITSPKPYASTTSQIFSGTATSSPLFPGASSNLNRLTGVIYSFTNLFSGSNITGAAAVTPGANGGFDWSFTATPFPGTNILTMQSEDVSGDISAMASLTFFYEAPARLTILTSGSGTGTFTITNGAMLNLGQGYSITARPVASVFSNWMVGGVISHEPTLQFVMQSNTVLTANFMARHLPGVVISSPKARERSGAPVLEGNATSSPVLPGANPNNVRLTNVVYWLTNAMTGTVSTGMAALTSGGAVTNWSITNRLLPGTNILAVQCQDVSGGLSPWVSRTFFYEVPARFTLTNAGDGTGTFTATASVAGDTLPTNGAMLNIGESYKLTAKPGPYSLFANWLGSPGSTSYTPAKSFVMQSNLILTATFVEISPVVAISSPTANQRTAAPAFKGTASGHFPITNVICSLANANGFATLAAGAGALSNWSIALVPSPGTNFLSVYCVDVNGNRSATIYRKFFYNVPARLTVNNAGTGSGSIRGVAIVAGNTPPADGAMLNIGEGYKITAIPDKASLFSNWVGSAGGGVLERSGNPALSFVMQSNLVLIATFVTNFFPPAAGTYNGLFFPSNDVSVNTSGMLYNLVLRDTGACSGKFLTPGGNYPFATNFDASGHADFSAGPLQVALTLDTRTPQITGTVSESSTTAPLVADLASNILPSAEYTILLSPSNDISTNLPSGDGYALVTNHEGVVTLSGALADGTRYNETVHVSQAGEIPVYVSLYPMNTSTDHGLLLGWINLTNLQAAAPTNALTWIKQKQLSLSPELYTNGFTNILSTQGAIWTAPPAGTPAVSFTNGELLLSNTDLFLAFTNIFVSDDKLADLGSLPTNSLTGSVNPKTGLLTVVFGDGKGRATDSALGAILQDTTNAGGFLLTTTNAGSMELQP
ncbi:MAG: choice-of-anchor tandem repeat GloVer-containing protein [Limisphaerales bacterium]